MCAGLWMRLFMAIPMIPSAVAKDPGCGRYYCHLTATATRSVCSFAERTDLWYLLPVINLSPVSTTPVITEKTLQGLIAGVVDTGDKFIAGFSNTEQLIASLIDTGVNIHPRISPQIFEKVRNSPNGILKPGGH